MRPRKQNAFSKVHDIRGMSVLHRPKRSEDRGIKYQFIDMKEKGMSKGEFTSVAQANGGMENMIKMMDWILSRLRLVDTEDENEETAK